MEHVLPVTKTVGVYTWILIKWLFKFAFSTLKFMGKAFWVLCVFSLSMMGGTPAKHEIYQRDPFERPL